MEENEHIINQNYLENNPNKNTEVNKRKSIILVCIILISLILGAYFYFIAFKSESLSLKARIGKFISPSSPSTPPPPGSSATIDINNTNNWKTYTDINYNYSIQYPNSWILKQGEDYERNPQVVIRNKNSKKAKFSLRKLPEIYIGVRPVYSTSGAVCANQSCKEIKNETIKIDGKTYTFPVVKADVVLNNDLTKNQFDFYAFTFYIGHKEFNLPNYSTPIGLTIYSSYKTETEEKIIKQILTTFKFLGQNQSEANNWKTYELTDLNKKPLNVTYKLPAQLGKPYCVNSACAAREAVLPGGTKFQVYGAGPTFYTQFSFEELLQDLQKNGFVLKPRKINNQAAIEYTSTTIESVLGGTVYTKIREVIIKIDNVNSVAVNHYIDKDSKGEVYFDQDDKLFDQILQTFKFTDQKIDWSKYSDTTSWIYFNRDFKDLPQRNFRFKYPPLFSVDNVDSGLVHLKINNKDYLDIEEFSHFNVRPGNSWDEKVANYLTEMAKYNPKPFSTKLFTSGNDSFVVYQLTYHGEGPCGGSGYNLPEWYCYLGIKDRYGFTVDELTPIPEALLRKIINSLEFR